MTPDEVRDEFDADDLARLMQAFNDVELACTMLEMACDEAMVEEAEGQ